MAIDNAVKRESALLEDMIEPDGVISDEDRQSLLSEYGYMGAVPPGPGGVHNFDLFNLIATKV